MYLTELKRSDIQNLDFAVSKPAKSEEDHRKLCVRLLIIPSLSTDTKLMLNYRKSRCDSYECSLET
jgi:hypothetical protein